jgi:hypothetical protein
VLPTFGARFPCFQTAHYICAVILANPRTGPKRFEFFFSLDIEDAKCFGAMLLSTFTIWFVTLISDSFDSIVCHWDGLNYVSAAITLYDIPHDNPWTK